MSDESKKVADSASFDNVTSHHVTNGAQEQQDAGEQSGIDRREQSHRVGQAQEEAADAGSSDDGVQTEQLAGEASADEEWQKKIAAAEQRLEEANGKIEILEQEIEEYRNRLARLQADFDNFRRRTNEEKSGYKTAYQAEVVNALLPVLDNLQRALQNVDSGDSLAQGLIMIERQFTDILKSVGVEPIAAVGEQFDPRWHEAIQTIDSLEHKDNEIVAEVTKGYRMSDRLLRASEVIVARRVEDEERPE